jgi:hypothetical protein
MVNWIVRSSVCAIVLGCFGLNADASPISYEFTGIASGDLNGVNFNNTRFQFVLTGDTSNVQNLGDGLYHNLASSVTFNIAGVGSGTMLDKYVVFSNQPYNAVGFSSSGTGFDLDRVDDWASSLATYQLTTSLAPTSGPRGVAGQFDSDPTTAGLLNLSTGFDVAFQAMTISSPEPATVTLLGMGFLAMGGILLRRR